ncbi:MAG: protein translocase subunit SecF [Bacillota bacterium]
MKFDFVGKRVWWFIISALVIIPGLISMAVQGFNLGIDFTGGTLLDLKFSRAVSVSEVRDALLPFGLEHSTIQAYSTGNMQEGSAEAVLIRTKVLTDDERRAALTGIADRVAPFEILRVEKVGAVIGGELAQKALLALSITTLGIIAYVSWRFEYKFAVAAVIALFHDILIVMGAFSLMQKEIDSTFVAAILTVFGYSISDTIVIFDRIRENLRTFRKGDDIEAMVNKSIWQTLARSIYTVLTVLMATLSLYLFGGETTKNFALALLIGFISGAYSSIFNASQIWVVWREIEQRKRATA